MVVKLEQGREYTKVDVVTRVLVVRFNTLLAVKLKYVTIRTSSDGSVQNTFHKRTFKAHADFTSRQFDSM